MTHRVVAEQAIQSRADHPRRSLNLPAPGGIFRAHVQYARLQLDGGDVVDRRPNGRTPGERDLFGRERSFAEKGRKRIGHEPLLASASPRRAELLRAAGIDFDVMPADIDETMDAEEWPDGYVRRIALTKAEAVRPQAGGRPVLAADTIVIVDGQVLGKPADANDAKRMLRMLSGREHTVMTAVHLVFESKSQTSVERTTVEFAPLSAAEIDWYLASGEPMDKAGAYAIQGLASRFAARINGSYTNVVGLPVAVVYQLCTNAGLLIS